MVITGAETYLRISAVVLHASLILSAVSSSLLLCSFPVFLICFSPKLRVGSIREHMYQNKIVI